MQELQALRTTAKAQRYARLVAHPVGGMCRRRCVDDAVRAAGSARADGPTGLHGLNPVSGSDRPRSGADEGACAARTGGDGEPRWTCRCLASPAPETLLVAHSVTLHCEPRRGGQHQTPGSARAGPQGRSHGRSRRFVRAFHVVPVVLTHSRSVMALSMGGRPRRTRQFARPCARRRRSAFVDGGRATGSCLELCQNRPMVTPVRCGFCHGHIGPRQVFQIGGIARGTERGRDRPAWLSREWPQGRSCEERGGAAQSGFT